jgi:ABC-type lipoprotein release transport system permease subunit
MRIFTMILLLAVIALGTDAIVYNGAYSQGVWRKLSDYTLELRGPTNQPAPAPRRTVQAQVS